MRHRRRPLRYLMATFAKGPTSVFAPRGYDTERFRPMSIAEAGLRAVKRDSAGISGNLRIYSGN